MSSSGLTETDANILSPVKMKRKTKSGINKPYELTETVFGKFVRIYLNYLIDSHNDESSAQDSYFRKLSDEKIYSIITSVLNPAQVETLAYHLSLDLRLTPDVGLGKGLDVADVKASCRHHSEAESEKIILNVIKTLKELKVDLSDKLEQRIKKEKTVRIQCKAGNISTKNKNEEILYLETPKKDKDRNTIYTDTLSKAALKLEECKEFAPELNNCKSFFRLLKYDLTRG